MQNITMSNGNGKLTITVDLKAQGVPSKSGKSEVIASTHGNVVIGDGVTVGLNVYRRV